MNRTAASFLVLVALLPGCSLFGSKPPDIQIQEKPTPVVCSAVTEKPDALDLGDTPPTLVLNTTNETWGYWFDANLYGVLAENLQAMRAWMNQSSSIRQKLVDCIESHNARATSSPSDP